MNFLHRIAENDPAVNAIFSNLRNFAICAAIIAAGAWNAKSIVWTDSSLYFDFATSFVLISSGLLLAYINAFHGFIKIKKSGIPKKWQFLLTVFYSIISLYLVTALSFKV